MRRNISLIIMSTVTLAVILVAIVTSGTTAQADPNTSSSPYMEVHFITDPNVLGRKPSAIALSVDGRRLLTGLRWIAWTSNSFNSVALAGGTEQVWQCPPNAQSCPIVGGIGGYVSYPVNIMLEWPDRVSRGFVFSALVISSPSLGTSVTTILG
jgi:hypothetical protein